MKASKALKYGPKVLYYLSRGKAAPVIVGWYLTYRCDQSCSFCGVSEKNHGELGTGEVLKIIDLLAKAGTRIIVFSGGEPLLVKDIGKILSHAKKRGINAGLTTNGNLVASRIDEIEGLDNLKLSFEGPKEIHDKIRGKGAFEKAMNAVEAARSRGIDVFFNTTICTYNINHIDEIVRISRELGLRVKFQPVSLAHAMGKQMTELIPKPAEFQRAFTRLRKMRKTTKAIANTDLSLDYLSQYPNLPPIKCRGAGIFLRIDPMGRSFFCTMQRESFAKNNILEHGVTATMNSLRKPQCSGCLCTSTLELNLFLEKGWKRPWQILRFFKIG